jgi:hypothetical protein
MLSTVVLSEFPIVGTSVARVAGAAVVVDVCWCLGGVWVVCWDSKCGVLATVECGQRAARNVEFAAFFVFSPEFASCARDLLGRGCESASVEILQF